MVVVFIISLNYPGCCPCCPAVWDGFLCWPPAPLNTIVEQPCPGDFPQLNLASIGINIIVLIISTLIELVNISVKYQNYALKVTCLLLDFAFRNCSSQGWLQENGLADRCDLFTINVHWSSLFIIGYQNHQKIIVIIPQSFCCSRELIQNSSRPIGFTNFQPCFDK